MWGVIVDLVASRADGDDVDLWSSQAALKVDGVVNRSSVSKDTIYINDPACGAGVLLSDGVRLLANARWCHTGTIPGSPIFSFDRKEAEALLDKDPRRCAVLQPLWRAREVMAGTSLPETFLLDLTDSRAPEAEWPILYGLLDARKRSDRRMRRASGPWWHLRRPRRELAARLAEPISQEGRPPNTVLARPALADPHLYTVLPAGARFDQSLVVWPERPWLIPGKQVLELDSSWALFGCLQSDVHRIWVGRFTMNFTRLTRYTVKLFQSFPLPEDLDALQDVVTRAKDFDATRQLAKKEGVTPAALARGGQSKAAMSALAQLNVAVRAAYGWHDEPDEEETMLRLAHIRTTRFDYTKSTT
ncbi:MAG: hypothetical protein HN348_26415 [Proteobacteria bacterium]|nr:hypothetical protein [Pseudomonadota bacterium]